MGDGDRRREDCVRGRMQWEGWGVGKNREVTKGVEEETDGKRE